MAFGDGWGHDGRTYDGKEMRQLVEALSGGLTGILQRDALKVSQQTSPTNTVKVAAGQIIIRATGSGLFGCYEVPNDADLTSPTFTGTGAQARTDRLIVRVTGGVPALEVVAGTPGAGTPPPPTVTGDNFETLCRVEIPASTTNITDAMIKDERKILGPPVSHFASSGLPSTPIAGQVNYEPDTRRLNVFDGTDWLPPFGVAWGVVGTPFESTSNDTPRTSSATSDMVMTGVPVRSDRLYKVFLHTRWSITVDAGHWELNFRVGGVEVDRLANVKTPGTATGEDGTATGAILWKPSTGTVNLDVRCTEVSGASTLTLVGASTVSRQFWVEDIGPRP